MTMEDLIIVMILLGGAAALWWGLQAVKRRGGEPRRGSAQRDRQDGAMPQPAPAHPQVPQRCTVVLGPPRQIRLDPSQIRPTPAPGIPIREGPPLTSPARCEPLWKEKGWRRNGTGYEGFYRTAGRAWRGLIQEPYPKRYRAFIWNPPLAQLSQRTRHAPCFQNGQSDGRYEVHYHTAPESLDHAISAIEDVLAEAFGQARR